MPSCKDICEAKDSKKVVDDEDIEEDYSTVDKDGNRVSTRPKKRNYYSNNFMGGYVARGIPGFCTAASSCLSGSNRIPPGLPPYMYQQGTPGGIQEQNRPRLHYDLEPILQDLYAVASKKPKSVNDREKAKEMDATSTGNTLTQINQEIFTTPPRAGGFVKTYQPPKPSHQTALDVCQKCESIYEAKVKNALLQRRPS